MNHERSSGATCSRLYRTLGPGAALAEDMTGGDENLEGCVRHRTHTAC